MGYLVPLESIEEFTGRTIEDSEVGKEFDTIGDTLMVKKYIVPVRNNEGNRQGKIEKRISRLVEGQFRFHVDTENFRRKAGTLLKIVGRYSELRLIYCPCESFIYPRRILLLVILWTGV